MTERVPSSSQNRNSPQRGHHRQRAQQAASVVLPTTSIQVKGEALHRRPEARAEGDAHRKHREKVAGVCTEGQGVGYEVCCDRHAGKEKVH